MLRRHVSFPVRIGMLAGIFVAFLAAQTDGRHAGANMKTLDLVSQPEPPVLANARTAFRQGDIVRMVGGRPEDLQRLLGIGGALFTRTQAFGSGSRNALLTQSPAPVVYQIVGARATRTGALHEFAQIGKTVIDASNTSNLAAYESWADKEAHLAQEEESESGPTPPAQAWTELQQTTVKGEDDHGNVFQNTISIFRLNDIDPKYDWYMILTDPESQPNYQGCYPFGGAFCGWWTHQRVFTMSTTPQAVLFDHGPINTISSTNASFSIGTTINKTGPGVTAGFSDSWQQPSVTTTDESDLVNGVGKWNEAFQDEGVFTKPPETSTGLFLSHQGSIFQVPEGTSSFQFTLDEPVTSLFQPRFGEPETDVNDVTVQINIYPPVFALSVNSLSIPPGGNGSFEITAVNPSTSSTALGLPWDVTNIPSWLTVSQTSGSSSASITLNVAPGTPLGTVTSLNVNTSPAFAAPSVEKSPLVFQVTVGQPSDTGVLLAGGINGSGVQKVADLYSSSSGTFDFQATMQSPRSFHTATRLPSGELLIAGGQTIAGTVLASAELFDPGTGQFSTTGGMMTDSRFLHTATLLQNGSVLITGGVDNTGLSNGTNSLATAELYNVNTQSFAASGSMAGQRANHSATLLLDGTVLVAGGLLNISLSGVSNTAETYDPATAKFTATAGNMTKGVRSHTATLLKDGHVLIAGGFDENGAASDVAELYNPATKTFSSVGNLNVARASHTATLLSDGTVLVTGGQGQSGNALASAELYNPETQTFTLLPNSMTTGRISHTATLLPAGTVLLACGSNSANPRTKTLGSTEIYDPQTQTFSLGPSTTPRASFTATLLPRLATTIALTSAPNPSTAGQTVTFTATITRQDDIGLRGSVTFQELTQQGTKVLQTVALQPSNQGSASFSSATLSVGTHLLQALYSGDLAHSRSTSNVVGQAVKSQVTTTGLQSSPNPSNDGQLVTFVATVTAASGTPTGSVTFRDNGAQLGTVGLTGNTATLSTSSLGRGSNPITATYSGDATFAGSSSRLLIQNVAKLSTTIALTSNPNPANFGQDVQIAATVTSSGNPPPSGAVLFRDGANNLQTVPLTSGVASFKISSLSVGSHSITGTYSGDLVHAGATSTPLVQQITGGLVTPSVALTVQPSTANAGQTVTFTATVSYRNPPVPTGSVTISDVTTAKIYGTASLNNGVGMSTNSTIPPGSYILVATYGGDGGIHYNGAQSNSVPLRVLGVGVGNPPPTPSITISATKGTRSDERVDVRLTHQRP